MPWHAADLVEEGIFYFKQVAKDGDLPPHVEHLRKSFLDFSCPIPNFTRAVTAEAVAGYITTGRTHTHPLFKSTIKICDEAVRLSHGDFAEEKWSDFYKKHLFDDLASCTISSDSNSRISVRSHFYYDAIVSETNELWEVFNKRRPGLPKPISCPKPDIAFFLPIYDTTKGLPVTKSVAFASKHWQQIPESSMAEPFTWSTLSELNTQAGDSNSARLKCYPWLIVELKRNGDDPIGSTREEVVCCQANNAATCALRLQKQLAKYATPLADQSHVQPIPTVTTIGPHVIVWVAYYAEDFILDEYFSRVCDRKTQDEAHIMRAIWRGNMTVAKDVIEFRMLLDNIYTRAMRVFKPNVAFYLNQWKHMYSQKDKPSSTPVVQSRLEEFRATVPMINALWSKYKEMEFETMAYQHWMSPVHFGLTLQQLVMSDHDKLLEKVGHIIDEKFQSLHFSEDSTERSRGSARGGERLPSLPIPVRPKENHYDGSCDEASDLFVPGSDDDEVGSQTIRASRAASDPDGRRRSGRLNRSVALAPEIHVFNIPTVSEPVTPNNRFTTGSVFSSTTPTVTPSSRYDTESSEGRDSSESPTTAGTPTASIASPTPSQRSLYSRSPEFTRALDTPVETNRNTASRTCPTPSSTPAAGTTSSRAPSDKTAGWPFGLDNTSIHSAIGGSTTSLNLVDKSPPIIFTGGRKIAKARSRSAARSESSYNLGASSGSSDGGPKPNQGASCSVSPSLSLNGDMDGRWAVGCVNNHAETSSVAPTTDTCQGSVTGPGPSA